MSAYWIIGSMVSYLIISLRNAYSVGLAQTSRQFINILIPFIMGGITVRMGEYLLPNPQIVHYIAGIGTIIFYIILYPIINKKYSDRYEKISKESRKLACFVAILKVWIFSSLILFFISKLATVHYTQIKEVINLILIPLKLIWFAKL